MSTSAEVAEDISSITLGGSVTAGFPDDSKGDVTKEDAPHFTEVTKSEPENKMVKFDVRKTGDDEIIEDFETNSDGRDDSNLAAINVVKGQSGARVDLGATQPHPVEGAGVVTEKQKQATGPFLAFVNLCKPLLQVKV